ncbi:MAG TPA: response regulator, partial [Polyangiaceae bacterium]|nr:response regulator [Polyangiaceae bacterium]
DIDGFSVMEKLRSDPQTADIPVHFISALDGRDRGMAMGAVGYLTKPASRSDLVRVVEALVPEAPGRRSSVLIIEDDENVADSLAERLRSEAIDAERATSAHAALAAIAARQFDCLVLDLSLPDMDGLEFLQTLAAQRGADMPSVVVYTGRALSKTEAQRLEEYAQSVVLKEGRSTDRLVDEVRLFARRLKQGLSVRGAPPATPEPAQLRLDGRKILVVDDDMRTVYAMCALLRAKGATVLTADTGRAALAELAAHPEVQAVLMDIMMPEMDGYEAMRRIRSEPRFAALPIIALTAKAMKLDREKCLEAGATDYLPKPLEPNLLLERLGRCFAERSHAG